MVKDSLLCAPTPVVGVRALCEAPAVDPVLTRKLSASSLSSGEFNVSTPSIRSLLDQPVEKPSAVAQEKCQHDQLGSSARTSNYTCLDSIEGKNGLTYSGVHKCERALSNCSDWSEWSLGNPTHSAEDVELVPAKPAMVTVNARPLEPPAPVPTVDNGVLKKKIRTAAHLCDSDEDSSKFSVSDDSVSADSDENAHARTAPRWKTTAATEKKR
jgi:hypothetical protein